MKLLLILDTVEFPLAPTPALARRCAGLLAQKGHTIHLLELYDGQHRPPVQPGCQQTLLPFSDERVMNQLLEFGQKGGTPVPLRLAKLCLHPQAALAAVRQILLKRPRRVSAAAKKIAQLDAQFHFDGMIAVAAPYAGSFALQQVETQAKKISWQMDPYAANRSYQVPGAYARERQLCQAIHRIFITPAMQADYQPGGPLADFAQKAQVVDFPSLVRQPATKPLAKGFPIRCVFCGSLYPELRTPHFALELFSTLNDPDVELVFVGGGWQYYPAQLLEQAKEILGERLVVTGPLSYEESAAYLASGDVLINLGNGVDNQVPSKLFEYFAQGKPILHLTKLANDPCLPYLNRWPLALCLSEQQSCSPEVLGQLSEFLHSKAQERIPFAQAEEIFFENTQKAAVNHILCALED